MSEFGKRVVEARTSWELGKQLGLTVDNEDKVIEVLVKVCKGPEKEPTKKRGRPRKKKVC